MNCNLCFMPYNRKSHLPRVLPCCGKSLCNECCSKMDKQPTKSCPYCRNPHSSPFQSLIKNIDLIDTIPEWNSSICQTHNRVNELICDSCEIEICAKCIQTHSGAEHNTTHIETFLDDIKVCKNDYKDWVDKAKKKRIEYSKIIKDFEMNMIKKINDQFESLIGKIRTFQQEAIFELDEKLKGSEIKNYFLEEGLDMSNTIKGCDGFLSSEEEKLVISQKIKFLKLNLLKPLMRWANRMELQKLQMSLSKIQISFQTEFKNPCEIKINENGLQADINSNFQTLDEVSIPVEKKEKSEQNRLYSAIDLQHRKKSCHKVAKVIKESCKLENEDYQDLALSVEAKIFWFFKSNEDLYNIYLNSVNDLLSKKRLNLADLKNIINTNSSEFLILLVKVRSETEVS